VVHHICMIHVGLFLFIHCMDCVVKCSHLNRHLLAALECCQYRVTGPVIRTDGDVLAMIRFIFFYCCDRRRREKEGR